MCKHRFRQGFKDVFCCLCYRGCNTRQNGTQQTVRNQYSVGAGLYTNYRASRTATKTLFAANNNNNANANNNQRAKSLALNTSSSSKQKYLQQEAPLLTNKRKQKPTVKHMLDLVPNDENDNNNNDNVDSLVVDTNNEQQRQNHLNQVDYEQKNVDHHDCVTVIETINTDLPPNKLEQQQSKSQFQQKQQPRDCCEKESHYLVSISEPTSTHSNVTTTTCPSSASSSIPLNTWKATLSLEQQQQQQQQKPVSTSNNIDNLSSKDGVKLNDNNRDASNHQASLIANSKPSNLASSTNLLDHSKQKQQTLNDNSNLRKYPTANDNYNIDDDDNDDSVWI